MSETWDEAYERFEDFIDEMEAANDRPVVTIMGYDYDPSRALRELAPIAYREEFNKWADSEGIDTDSLTGYDKMEGN